MISTGVYSCLLKKQWTPRLSPNFVFAVLATVQIALKGLLSAIYGGFVHVTAFMQQYYMQWFANVWNTTPHSHIDISPIHSNSNSRFSIWEPTNSMAPWWRAPPIKWAFMVSRKIFWRVKSLHTSMLSINQCHENSSKYHKWDPKWNMALTWIWILGHVKNKKITHVDVAPGGTGVWKDFESGCRLSVRW